MKNKRIYLIVSILLALSSGICLVASNNNFESVLNSNVEALLATEHATGSCMEIENDCIGRCPHCGELVIAYGHKGPAYDIKHVE